MSERFSITGLNEYCYQIDDKFKKLPFPMVFNNFHDAKLTKDWLNENCYKRRFELREITGEGLKNCFTVWDNIENDNVKFTPLIQSSNYRAELEEWVDFLNNLYEENSINE